MADDLLKITIGDLLDRQAARFGERDALIHVEHGVRFSYAAFRDECNRVAKGMLALGIGKGDHIGIWATNYPEWVVAQFATAKIGAVLVTVNPSYRTHELQCYVKFVTDFPMTVTGKIQKYKMRDVAIEELGLDAAARVATA